MANAPRRDVLVGDIQTQHIHHQIVDQREEASGKIKPYSDPGSLPSLVQYDPSFGQLVGSIERPSKLSLLVQSDNPFFHEACVYIPRYDELYITSTLLEATKSSKMASILISRIKLQRSSSDGDNHVTGVEWAKMRPPPGIDMPNGGVNYSDDSVLFCAQGSLAQGTGGIYHMPRSSAAPKPLVTNFHGRDFNSPNDVVVDRSGGVWFTDPCYGYEQEFRKRPKLPNQVYRFDPESGDCRVVADGFERPNGICFAPGEDVVYITDTGAIHGDGGLDATRPACIYAFDVFRSPNNAPFLTNRRVFAFAAEGLPDSIKCDVHGNVYSGCGDGVEIWNPDGVLIGKILVPGGVANFCFGREGEVFLCAETKLWRVTLARETKGDLLGI